MQNYPALEDDSHIQAMIAKAAKVAAEKAKKPKDNTLLGHDYGNGVKYECYFNMDAESKIFRRNGDARFCERTWKMAQSFDKGSGPLMVTNFKYVNAENQDYLMLAEHWNAENPNDEISKYGTNDDKQAIVFDGHLFLGLNISQAAIVMSVKED
jgi:hypothetical protein